MNDQVKITAKNLGYIELNKYCPHCFFYLLRFGFKPPFSFFGGAVFKWMEDMERAAVHHQLKHNSCLPEEFEPFCNLQAPVEFPRHWSKYGYTHESGVFVYGMPDDIFMQDNGQLCVIDFKTAGYKGTNEDFYPQYRVQVVAYANIAELGLNLGEVDRGGLFYWAADVDKFDPAKQYKNGRIMPAFKVGTLEIEIDYKILHPLLKEVKDVWNSRVPPDGVPGCDNCKKLARLFAIQAEIDAVDERLLYEYRAFPDITWSVINRRYKRSWAIRDAFAELRTSELLFPQEAGQEPGLGLLRHEIGRTHSRLTDDLYDSVSKRTGDEGFGLHDLSKSPQRGFANHTGKRPDHGGDGNCNGTKTRSGCPSPSSGAAGARGSGSAFWRRTARADASTGWMDSVLPRNDLAVVVNVSLCVR